MARGRDTSRHAGRQVHFGAWVDRLNATVARDQMGDFAEDDPADSARNTIPTDVNTGKGGPKPQPVFSRINDAVTPPHVRQAMREDEIRGLMEGGTSTAY